MPFFPLLLSFLFFKFSFSLVLSHSFSFSLFLPHSLSLNFDILFAKPILSSWPMLPLLCCLSLSDFLSCNLGLALSHALVLAFLPIPSLPFVSSLFPAHSFLCAFPTCFLLRTHTLTHMLAVILLSLGHTCVFLLTLLSAPPYCSLAPFHVLTFFFFFLHPLSHAFSCYHSPSHVLAVSHAYSQSHTLMCSHRITPFLAPLVLTLSHTSFLSHPVSSSFLFSSTSQSLLRSHTLSLSAFLSLALSLFFLFFTLS